MSGNQEKLNVAQLAERDEAEVRSLLTAKAEELRKARFKHAVNQLPGTHVLRLLRRDIAKLKTALSQRQATQLKETT